MRKIMVNGALMDEEYFNDNVQEAKEYFWKKGNSSELKEHKHCIVCNVPLSNDEKCRIYTYKALVLCGYCWTNYVSS